MKILKYLFYVCFGTFAQYFPGEYDYSKKSAILGGAFLSLFLSLNILTILIIFGCGNIVKIVFDSWGLVVFFIFLLLPFIFVYFSCIHKKKYIKIREQFNYMDKSLSKRLLAVLTVLLYGVGSGILFGWSCYYYFK